MQKLSLLYFLWILALFYSCRPEPKIPQWDTGVLTPLVHSRVDLGDLVADSNLISDADGALSLIFRNQLAEIKPGEIITPLNAEFHNTVNLQSIDLGERVINDGFSLGDLALGGSPAGQFIIFNNGNTAPVPPIFNVGPKNFSVDATDLFQSITLIEGEVELSLFNQLPVPLTFINFRLENQVSGDILAAAFIDTLKPQELWTETFSLANETIEGQLRAVLLTLSSPGSDGQPVVIDTSDKVLVTLTLRDLVPSSATAIFPSQNLASDTADTDPITAGNAQLEKIVVAKGKIFLNATSTIEDDLRLEYIVPSATRNGIPLSFNEVIPAAAVGGSSSFYREIDISGYEIDLTGRPYESGVYNRFYTVLIAAIDSSGRLVHLSLNDSITFHTGIVDLTAAEGYGYLGKDLMASTSLNPVDAFDLLDSGNFDLDNARLGISVENFIGAPIDLRLNQLQGRQANQTQNLSWTQLGQNITVPSATIVAGRPKAALQEIIIDKAESNLDQLVEIKPDTFYSDIETEINGSTPVPVYDQFIFSEFGVRSSFFLEIPLHLSADGLSFSDSGSFNYSDLDPDDQLQKGLLNLIGDNNFPLHATVDLILFDENRNMLGKLTSEDQLLAAETDAQGRAIAVTRSIAEYPLDAVRIEQLRQTTTILFSVTLDTPQAPEKVKIYNSNYLDLTLSGDLTIRTR